MKVRPAGARVVAYRGANYHLHGGVWYKPFRGKFVVFRPFAGIRIKVLPPNCYRFTARSRNYHYYYGTYYVHVPETDEYEVVAPPIGAKIDELPDDYTEETVDDKTYYVLDDTYYTYLEDEELYEVVDLP